MLAILLISLPAFGPAGPSATLGVPLGTVVTVHGAILPDDARRQRSDLGKTLLRVDTVNGRKLTPAVILPLRQFEIAPLGVLPTGRPVSLVGYETGGYTGIPEAAFKFIPRVATTPHQFESWFQACAVVKDR